MLHQSAAQCLGHGRVFVSLRDGFMAAVSLGSADLALTRGLACSDQDWRTDTVASETASRQTKEEVCGFRLYTPEGSKFGERASVLLQYQ